MRVEIIVRVLESSSSSSALAETSWMLRSDRPLSDSVGDLVDSMVRDMTNKARGTMAIRRLRAGVVLSR